MPSKKSAKKIAKRIRPRQTPNSKPQTPLQFEAISIFPEVFGAYMNASILGRAQKTKKIAFKAYDLRTWTHDRHRTVDDKPFGGGPGMVMKPQPFLEALAELGLRQKRTGRPTAKAKRARVIVTAANGKPFTHADAVRLSKYDRLVFLCGRYEGIDQRVIDGLADESFRIGEYVLTGGELPAMVMMDAVARHIPGVLGKEASLDEESWSCDSHESGIASHEGEKKGTGEYPQYTRPDVWLGMEVPEVLRSGDHKKVGEWRKSHRE